MRRAAGTTTTTGVSKLAAGFTGELLSEGDAGYDEARAVYNGMFDRRPGLIARCHRTDDVVAAVFFARENGLDLAVRSGGHSFAGFSSIDGGVLIDMSRMRTVDVDPEARIAHVGGGALVADLDSATQAHSLATVFGSTKTIGVAGLALSGGYGYRAREYGLTCDNIVAAEVVLADGSVVRASDSDDPDLFWAIRGGGGNFGIVTSFEFRLHPRTQLFGWSRMYAPETLGDALSTFGEVAPRMPEQTASAAVMTMRGWEHEVFPAELHNRPLVWVTAAYDGSEDDGTEVLGHVFPDAPHVLEMRMPMPYVEDDYTPTGAKSYSKSGQLDALSDGAIDAFASHAFDAGSPWCFPAIYLRGGAIARVGETDTAYAGRDAVFDCLISNMWEDPAENDARIAHTMRFHESMEPFYRDEMYLNFSSGESEDRVRRAFGANYERLVALKDRYDPENLFRRNANIVPSSRM